MKSINLILIGVGPHAKRVYIPALCQLQKRYNVRLLLAIDLLQEEEPVKQFFSQSCLQPELLLISPFKGAMPVLLRQQLNEFVATHEVHGVIIATEPTSHRAYAEWALEKELHILMDKPISTRDHIVSDPLQAHGLLDDYYSLLQAYEQLQLKKRTAFIVNVQRRFHPGFRKVLSLLEDTARRTNCPVTGIQSTHCDGQWRLPSEIVTQAYHPYNTGYGKASHSGYHIFDMVCQFYKAGTLTGKMADDMQVMSAFVQPKGLLLQLQEEDYYRYFGGVYEKVQRYNDTALWEKYEDYGEVDASILVKMRKRQVNIANISINLLHNSFARRDWMLPGADLYKGNGRVKHEYHSIQQGPFQNIQIHSYQAKDKHQQNDNSDFELGGNNHFDIYVFRNAGMLAGSVPLEVIRMSDIAAEHGLSYSALVTEQVKTRVVAEFLDFINGDLSREQLTSDIADHRMPVQLMHAAYLSHIRQEKRIQPMVTCELNAWSPADTAMATG